LGEAFGRYVDRRIAEQLIGSRETIAERGEHREAALMFCDLVGFTGLSERVEPEKVVEFLNAYFSVVTREIAGTDGIIDKYIGDAVMAYWCPPFVLQNEGALPSADAALLCLGKMPEITEARRRIFDGTAKMASASVRIGIASGTCLAGSVGAQERRNYTVIGDTVNLASRIEFANRIYRTTILVCPKTAESIRTRYVLREIDTVLLPGIEGGAVAVRDRWNGGACDTAAKRYAGPLRRRAERVPQRRVGAGPGMLPSLPCQRAR